MLQKPNPWLVKKVIQEHCQHRYLGTPLYSGNVKETNMRGSLHLEARWSSDGELPQEKLNTICLEVNTPQSSTKPAFPTFENDKAFGILK